MELSEAPARIDLGFLVVHCLTADGGVIGVDEDSIRLSCVRSSDSCSKLSYHLWIHYQCHSSFHLSFPCPWACRPFDPKHWHPLDPLDVHGRLGFEPIPRERERGGRRATKRGGGAGGGWRCRRNRRKARQGDLPSQPEPGGHGQAHVRAVRGTGDLDPLEGEDRRFHLKGAPAGALEPKWLKAKSQNCSELSFRAEAGLTSLACRPGCAANSQRHSKGRRDTFQLRRLQSRRQARMTHQPTSVPAPSGPAWPLRLLRCCPKR